jgi:uncharacterized SAM-binding protein YcdF (DUF218 family)
MNVFNISGWKLLVLIIVFLILWYVGGGLLIYGYESNYAEIPGSTATWYLFFPPIAVWIYALLWAVFNPDRQRRRKQQKREIKEALDKGKTDKLKQNSLYSKAELQALVGGRNVLTKDLKFFQIDPKLFFLLGIVTSQFYHLYWFYRQWEAVNKARKRKVLSIVRSIFAPIYVHELFLIIGNYLNEKGVKASSLRWLSLGYIFTAVGFNLAVVGLRIIINNNTYPDFQLTGLTLYTIAPILAAVSISVVLFMAQKIFFKFYSQKQSAEVKKHKFAFGEIVVIVFGIYFSIQTWLNLFRTMIG